MATKRDTLALILYTTWQNASCGDDVFVNMADAALRYLNKTRKHTKKVKK